MERHSVRLRGITLENFKNIEKSKIEFVEHNKNSKASLTGIYGQNGSGKTSVIESIQLLKYALIGMPIPDNFVHFIQCDQERAKLSFRFEISSDADQEKYNCEYSFSLIKKSRERVIGNNHASQAVIVDIPVISGEVLKFSYASEIEGRTNIPKQALLYVSDSEDFLPAKKAEVLLGKIESKEKIVEIAQAESEGRSVLFSKWLFEKAGLRKSEVKEHGSEREKDDFERYYFLLKRLKKYGGVELFVIDTKTTSPISRGFMPLSFKILEGTEYISGTVPLVLDGPFQLSEEDARIEAEVLQTLNIVLEKLIPGLMLRYQELGITIDPEGNVLKHVRLFSVRSGRQLPIQYESEGIRKIISVLQLLIWVYNYKSITVAVDELDSGVFEYLLGEILKVLQEKGKGQLIFTSHNLRPLEVLEPNTSIVFTTANSNNRFLRITNLKKDNNLRDVYYRALATQSQKEVLYEPTNLSAISLAFLKAGHAMKKKGKGAVQNVNEEN